MESLSLILLEQQKALNTSQISVFSQNQSFLKNQCASFRNIQEPKLNSRDKQQMKLSINDKNHEHLDFEDQFNMKIQLDLRRFTSFQNGFMEFHIKILKQSFFDCLKNIKIQQKDISNQIQKQLKDIKSLIFNENYYSLNEIHNFKNRFLKNIQEFKILKQIFQCLNKSQTYIIKDAIQMVCWIIQNSDQVTLQIKEKNSVNQISVELLKQQFQNYLLNNQKITTIKSKQNQQNIFYRFIDSWLYTIIIAKLGYFQNDCYCSNLTLYHHLKNLLNTEEKDYPTASYNDDDFQLFDRKQSKKRIKLCNSYIQ